MFRILIVDDTKMIHTFVKELLKGVGGIEFCDAFDGVQAIEILKRDSNFNLVLLDWEMPKMTGPECLQEIKSFGMQTPVIMMTTKNAPADIARLLENGAAEYLLKPFTTDILTEKIAYVCGEDFSYAG